MRGKDLERKLYESRRKIEKEAVKKAQDEADKILTHMGSWSSNYESWKEFKKSSRYLLIKYEDMIKDKER